VAQAEVRRASNLLRDGRPLCEWREKKWVGGNLGCTLIGSYQNETLVGKLAGRKLGEGRGGGAGRERGKR